MFWNFMMPGDQILLLKYEEMEKCLNKLSGEVNENQKEEVEGYKKWLEKGKEAFPKDYRTRLYVWPRYDYAWGVLRSIRRGLVGIIPPADLVPFLEECHTQLPYFSGEESRELKLQLKERTKEVKKAIGVGPLSEEVKANVISLMTRLDDAQAGFWWKFNDYVVRMFLFAAMLIMVLVSIFYFEKEWRIILTLGALGGLLGGLIRTEDVKAHLGTFYLRRIHTFLSPLLGASGALGVYFLMKAGILNLLPSGQTDNEWYFYSIAFVSGFSERALISFLEKAVSNFQPAGRSKEEEPERGKKGEDAGAKPSPTTESG